MVQPQLVPAPVGQEVIQPTHNGKGTPSYCARMHSMGTNMGQLQVICHCNNQAVVACGTVRVGILYGVQSSPTIIINQLYNKITYILNNKGTYIGIKLLPVMWVCLHSKTFMKCGRGTRCTVSCIPVSQLVPYSFSTIPICPLSFTCLHSLLPYNKFHVYLCGILCGTELSRDC